MRSLLPATLLLLTACQVSSGTPRIVEATFCRQLTAYQAPLEATTSFLPTERVNLALRLDGRPRRGEVGVRFYYRDLLLGESAQDLAELNDEVLLSRGQATALGFWLDHREVLPISERYRAEILIDRRLFRTVDFAVVPAADAGASRVYALSLVDGHPEIAEEATLHGLDWRLSPSVEAVVLEGRADLGQHSWLQIEWVLEGKRISDGEERSVVRWPVTDVAFEARLPRPPAGWPRGRHWAVVTLDDAIVGQLSFTFFEP